jgi:hypothetical protein
MAKGMSQQAVRELAREYMPSFLRQREEAMKWDAWHRGEQTQSLYIPRGAEPEYQELASKSPNAWGGLLVTSVVQNAELTGMRMPGSEKNMTGWRTWQRNGMDAKQPRLYRGSCAHGVAFIWAEKSKDPLSGEVMSKYHLASAADMACFYNPDDDEWPEIALLATPTSTALGVQDGWAVRVFDSERVYFLQCKGDGWDVRDWSFIDSREHGASICPVVRYAPNIDIMGRTNSDLMGMVPLLARIDQDTFDRLIVQRFGAWKIRWIAGMIKPTSTQEAEAQKLKLRMESILIAEGKDTKFGTLDATDLAGFISARDSDLRDLSALSQTPPHHLLGVSSNLQAESLAAAESGLQRKSREHRLSWGESHEQLFRLDAHMRNDTVEARAYEMQAKWRDTESRSLEQAAMALGILATNLKVPVEMLWERIPGWTDNDVERAKNLVLNGSIDRLLAEVEQITKDAATQPQQEGQNQPEPQTTA